jgi:hypothetical protein
MLAAAAHDSSYAAGPYVPSYSPTLPALQDKHYLTSPRLKTMVASQSQQSFNDTHATSGEMSMIIELGKASKETKGTPGGWLEFNSSPVRKEPH